MRFLLDTHTFLWFISDDESLSATVSELLESPDNDLLLSIASLWEMAIKVSLGKLTLEMPFLPFVLAQLQGNGIGILGVVPEHTGIVASLPFHHRDPFDRLIVAQAISEDVALVSKDEILDLYGITRIW